MTEIPDLHDLRLTTMLLLRALPRDGSVRSLARSLGWAPSQVQQYLVRLSKDRLARRQPAGWVLTPTGLAVLRGADKAHAAYVRETTSVLLNATRDA